MYLNVEGLSLSFENKTLYDNASFRILPKDKIGVIGNNGVGKSTLINILCGKIIPDAGKIEFDEKIKVGYLDQYISIDQNISIKDYLLKAFEPLFKKEEEINELLKEIEIERNIDRQTKLLNRVDNLRIELEEKDFYQINTNMMKISTGLGIVNYGLDTYLNKLSGGQKIKVILTKLLLEKPDLLILDEPTNFLDAVHVDWLVKFLKEYDSTFLIVSHNQDFLNDVCNVILEIEYQKITRYKGNYNDYVYKKSLAQESLENAYKKQQKEIKKLKEYIDKNLVRASTTKSAQSRRTKLEKMDIIKFDKSSDVYLNLKFNYEPISSHKLLEINDLEIGYYGRSLLPKMSLLVKSGEHIGITGFNGIGKTTLLKTLIGEIPLICGSFKFTENAKIAYFEQEHIFVNLELSPLQEISNLYPQMGEKDIRNYLARCGLRGPLAVQPIKELSGGEQAKLKLCKMTLIKANVLIFDEPTNHLDKNAKDGLAKAIKEYPGTVLVVTHEESFLNSVVDRVFNIEQLLLG